MPNYGLLIDYEYCTGCHSCEVVCKETHHFPIGKWGIKVLDEGPWQKDDSDDAGNCFNWNKIPVPTDLCDLCADRVADGRKPSCVHNCLANVMTFGPLKELVVELAKKPKQVLWAPTNVDITPPADVHGNATETVLLESDVSVPTCDREGYMVKETVHGQA